MSDAPNRKLYASNSKLTEQNFELQVIQRCLELQKPKERKASLQLVIIVGLVGGKNKGEFLEFIEKADPIPKWPERPIEPLNSYIDSGKGVSTNTAHHASQIPPGLKDEFEPGSLQSQTRSGTLPPN